MRKVLGGLGLVLTFAEVLIIMATVDPPKGFAHPDAFSLIAVLIWLVIGTAMYTGMILGNHQSVLVIASVLFGIVLLGATQAPAAHSMIAPYFHAAFRNGFWILAFIFSVIVGFVNFLLPNPLVPQEASAPDDQFSI